MGSLIPWTFRWPQLAKDPAEYRIGDIVRTLEGGDQPLLDCEHPECTLLNGCQFRHIKEEAYQAFYDKLNEYTLASLTTSPEAQALIERLNHEATRRVTKTVRGPITGSILIKPRSSRKRQEQPA